MVRCLGLMYLVFWISIAPVMASGYSCEGLCIVVDSARYQVRIVDDITIEAGTTRNKTMKLLKKSCRLRAENMGYANGAIVVDDLWFRATRDTESDHRDWYSITGEADLAAVGSLGGSFAVIASEEFRVSHGVSSHFRDDRTLEVRIQRSNPSHACSYDESIPTGRIPYVGNFPVLD